MDHNIKRRSLLAASVCALIPFSPASLLAQQDDTVIGKIARIRSAAVAMQNAMPRVLEVGSEVLLGDVISTGSDARLQIDMSDGGELTLGENTIFVVLEYIASQNGGNAVMRLLEGAFLATSGKIMETADATFIIETQTATIGIRGTTVWGGPLNHDLEVVLISGKGVYVETASGRVELNEAGQGTSVISADTAPTAIKNWPKTKVARAVATVSFD